MTAAVAGIVFGVVGGVTLGSVVPAIAATGLPWVPAIIAFLAVPVAIGIAVLRYRLYEIDRIVSRTISYLIVTAILVAAFAVAILLFQALLAPLTGGNTVAVAASTLIVAALFQPFRRRVQAAVDHLFNRARYDADRTAESFAGRLRDEVDLGAVQADLLTTAVAALHPRSAGIWIRGSGAGR